MRIVCLAAVIALGSLAACSDDGGEEPVVPIGDAELAVGGALDESGDFIDLAPGAEVELVPGSQGGFHIWLSHEIHGVDGELDLVRSARRVEDGVLVLRAIPMRFEVPADAMADWWAMPQAVPSFMCPSPIGIKVFDTEIELTSQLVDMEGNVVAQGSVIVTPRCPEDAFEFCESICSG